MKVIWWVRRDFRVADNPALAWAAEKGEIIAVYVGGERDGERMPGGASRWWLHGTLAALGARIPLILRRGEALEVLRDVIAETGAEAVCWNRMYEPAAMKRDAEVKALLREMGVTVESFNGALLCEPWEVKNLSGGDFKVFTPFWKRVLSERLQDVRPVEVGPLRWVNGVASERLEDWNLRPHTPNWAAGWEDVWQPGEAGALARLERFISSGLKSYGSLRDRPDLGHFSGLSAALHWGEVGVRTVWRAVQAAKAGTDGEKFCAELGWREFSHHLLYHFPELGTRNFKPGFDAYPWEEAPALLAAWQRGMTGYPMVDAGMRELWATGFMHNRVRMVAASFLIKHLRIDWREGEKWFWDTLVDADAAANAASWQWVAGSGADAAPYFRIFNPMEQGRKFDPQGAYVKRWCPELARLPVEYLHAPWEAPEMILRAAGVELGETYPRPVVEHAKAREAALRGYEAVKAARAE